MPPSLLLIDTNTESLEATSAMLERHGHGVLRAASFQQVHDAIAHAAPAVIVIEPVLEGIDGFELCRAIRNVYPGYRPTILMASHRVSGAAHEAKATEVGAQRFFARPAMDERLVEEVALELARLVDAAGTSDPIGDTCGDPAKLEIAALVDRVFDDAGPQSGVSGGEPSVALVPVPGVTAERPDDVAVGEIAEVAEPVQPVEIAARPVEVLEAEPDAGVFESAEVEHGALVATERSLTVPDRHGPRRRSSALLYLVGIVVTGLVGAMVGALVVMRAEGEPVIEASASREPAPGTSAPALPVQAVAVQEIPEAASAPEPEPVQADSAPQVASVPSASAPPEEAPPEPVTPRSSRPTTEDVPAREASTVAGGTVAAGPTGPEVELQQIVESQPAEQDVAAVRRALAELPALGLGQADPTPVVQAVELPSASTEAAALPAASTPGDATSVASAEPAVEPSVTLPLVAPRLIPRTRTVPVYPPIARRVGAGGTVVLHAMVQVDGTVRDIEILVDPAPQYGLGDSAAEAVLDWRYEPGTRGGEPVDMPVTIRIDFEPR